jgi:hypothetical protein
MERLLIGAWEGNTMCEKCKDLDVHIARCERLKAEVRDEALAEVADLLEDYRAEKAALHRAEK